MINLDRLPFASFQRSFFRRRARNEEISFSVDKGIRDPVEQFELPVVRVVLNLDKDHEDTPSYVSTFTENKKALKGDNGQRTSWSTRPTRRCDGQQALYSLRLFFCQPLFRSHRFHCVENEISCLQKVIAIL
jgi:hypothetical protein